MDSVTSDDKYITFNRESFMGWLGSLVAVEEPWKWSGHLDVIEIGDAVVIRRQDYFATAALAGYANSIVIAAKLTDDPKKRDELIAVADYFQRQSELAAEEGWKTPDV